MSRRREHALNRASWDAMASAHGNDRYYDGGAVVAGASSFTDLEERALAAACGPDVAGRRILHVQCHLGFDAITLARRGARVTAVDFSPVALAKARELAGRAAVDVRWLCADVCDLPPDLHGEFELAWATHGILCWIADVRAWMRSVAATIAPGGHLVLIDGHPLRRMIASANPLQLWAPYGGGEAQRIADGRDYATGACVGPQVQFAHSLGETVTAAVDAGLRVVELTEHLDRPPGRAEDADADGRFRLRVDGQALPLLFTLRAVRAAAAQ